MATLLNYPDLELPLFGPETQVVYGAEGLLQAGQQQPDSIVRHTRLSAHGAGSLAEALLAADMAFKFVASHCGAVVLPHTWGLYKTSTTDMYPAHYDYICKNPPTRLIPENYLLVAEVPVVRDTFGSTPKQNKKIYDAWNRHRRLSPKETLVWADYGLWPI